MLTSPTPKAYPVLFSQELVILNALIGNILNVDPGISIKGMRTSPVGKLFHAV